MSHYFEDKKRVKHFKELEFKNPFNSLLIANVVISGFSRVFYIYAIGQSKQMKNCN